MSTIIELIAMDLKDQYPDSDVAISDVTFINSRDCPGYVIERNTDSERDKTREKQKRIFSMVVIDELETPGVLQDLDCEIADRKLDDYISKRERFIMRYKGDDLDRDLQNFDRV